MEFIRIFSMEIAIVLGSCSCGRVILGYILSPTKPRNRFFKTMSRLERVATEIIHFWCDLALVQIQHGTWSETLFGAI